MPSQKGWLEISNTISSPVSLLKEVLPAENFAQRFIFENSSKVFYSMLHGSHVYQEMLVVHRCLSLMKHSTS